MPGAEGWLSIGALSRATGIPVETLRTWEARYDFPVPRRKPSGHRVYPSTTVPRLRRMAEALENGHRAGEIVGATDEQLSALLPAGSAGPVAGSVEESAGSLEAALEAVAAFDAERLTRLLLSDSARMGVLEFVSERLAPLVRRVGEAWSDGTLEIRHEHFLSERVSDLLRSLRLPLEARARGPLVVFATLPGEAHGLGLQMATLVVSAAGCRVLLLGTQVPPDQIAALAREAGAAAVAVSVSAASRLATVRRQVAVLRRLLPPQSEILLGGEGARVPVRGAAVIVSLPELDRWARHRPGA
jgi:methanogenic corrinoid protein MtbC1